MQFACYWWRGHWLPRRNYPPYAGLAMELGVHFNTVGEAYRELAAEGWLDLRHGRGATVIARTAPAKASPERFLEFRERLRNLVAQMRAGGVPAPAVAAELRTLAKELKTS